MKLTYGVFGLLCLCFEVAIGCFLITVAHRIELYSSEADSLLVLIGECGHRNGCGIKQFYVCLYRNLSCMHPCDMHVQ